MVYRDTTLRCALFAAALASGMAVVSLPARAADDGYQNVFSSVLSTVGLMKEDRSPEIDYRERAPLVLPPKMALVPPVKPGAGRPASWPQDPDVIAARKADEAAHAPMEDMLANSRGGTLSKEELLKGRVAGGGGEVVPGECNGFQTNNRACNLLSPDELKAQGERFKAANGGDEKKEEAIAGVEPERVYLTQPPKGYLKATKTVKATAEAPKEQVDESNPKSANYYHAPTNE